MAPSGVLLLGIGLCSAHLQVGICLKIAHLKVGATQTYQN
jgi:hypothetical protein